MPRSRPAEQGQASVEMLAALPFVLLAGAIAWQLALAGWTAWMSAHAARAAARADAVGLAVTPAARSALPSALRAGLEVRRQRTAGVEVRVRVPTLIAGVGGPVTVTSSASLGRRER